MSEQVWRTETPGVFEINGRRLAIVKRGRAQAVQVEQLNRWLKEHIAPLSESLRGKDQADPSTGLGMFTAFLGELTADAQMDLAKALVGAKDAAGQPIEPEWFEDEYSIDWVLDALEVAGQTDAMQKLMTAFFTNRG